MDDKIKSRLLKLKELAERGVGGEKITAQKKLDKLLKQNGLTKDDLTSDQVNYYLFSYNGMYRKKLLGQCIFKTLGPDCKMYHTKGTRNKLGAYCTPAQKVEIELDYEFYCSLFEEELESFLTAFIAQQDIYPQDAPVNVVDPMSLTPDELDKMRKVESYKSNITHRTRSKMIEKKDR